MIDWKKKYTKTTHSENKFSEIRKNTINWNVPVQLATLLLLRWKLPLSIHSVFFSSQKKPM